VWLSLVGVRDFEFRSVLWYSWLGDREGKRPIKVWATCLHRKWTEEELIPEKWLWKCRWLSGRGSIITTGMTNYHIWNHISHNGPHTSEIRSKRTAVYCVQIRKCGINGPTELIHGRTDTVTPILVQSHHTLSDLGFNVASRVRARIMVAVRIRVRFIFSSLWSAMWSDVVWLVIPISTSLRFCFTGFNTLITPRWFRSHKRNSWKIPEHILLARCPFVIHSTV